MQAAVRIPGPACAGARVPGAEGSDDVGVAALGPRSMRAQRKGVAAGGGPPALCADSGCAAAHEVSQAAGARGSRSTCRRTPC